MKDVLLCNPINNQDLCVNVGFFSLVFYVDDDPGDELIRPSQHDETEWRREI